MNRIIAEVEGTISGTVRVVQKNDGTIDVCTAPTGSEDFTVRHPDGNAMTAVRALAHYLEGEAYRRTKVESTERQAREQAEAKLAAALESIRVLISDDRRHSTVHKANAKMILQGMLR